MPTPWSNRPWWLGGNTDPGRDFYNREPDVDLDPYYLGGPAAPGQPGYDVPPAMVPGVQPWEAGEPAGQPDPDDWRLQRYGSGEALEVSAQPVACYTCNGSGEVGGGLGARTCSRCGGSRWEP